MAATAATSPRIVPFGERAYLVELGDQVDIELNADVHALARRIDARGDELGVERTVPAYASLLVRFDPEMTDANELRDALVALAAVARADRDDERTTDERTNGETVEIAVRYGAAHGPDLEDVARRTGLSPAAVVDLHAGGEYHVFMLGFAPGFPYLGPLPEALRLPRRDTPRLRVPPGSVAIAAGQTAVYPHQTAGGWHLLGRTEAVLWDGGAEPPARLRPGDRVRFVPI